MADPREFWNHRYGLPGDAYGNAPNDFLKAHAAKLSSPVLSLGEGDGRNAVYLAQQGLAVTGVDLSAVALAKAQARAAQAGVSITTLEADLEAWRPEAGAFGGVVLIWCHLPAGLRAKVHRACVEALRPGGVLVLEAYTPRQLALGTGGPRSADMLFEVEDLRADFAGLEVEVLREVEREVKEGEWHHGPSAVVQVVASKSLK